MSEVGRGGVINTHLTVSSQSLEGLAGFVASRAIVGYHQVLWCTARFKKLRIAGSLIPFEARKVLMYLTAGWTWEKRLLDWVGRHRGGGYS